MSKQRPTLKLPYCSTIPKCPSATTLAPGAWQVGGKAARVCEETISGIPVCALPITSGNDAKVVQNANSKPYVTKRVVNEMNNVAGPW